MGMFVFVCIGAYLVNTQETNNAHTHNSKYIDENRLLDTETFLLF